MTRGHADTSTFHQAPETCGTTRDATMSKQNVQARCTTINPQPTSNAHDLTPTHLHTTQPASIHDTSHQLQHFTLYHPIPSYNTTTYNLQPTTRSHTATQPTSYILHPQKHYPSTHHPTNLSPCSLQSSNNLQPTTYNILQPTTFDFQPTTGNNRAASNLEPRRLDHCIIDLQPATCDIQHATCNIPYNI